MKVKSASVALAGCLALLVVPSVPAIEAQAQITFNGIPVGSGGRVVDGRVVYEGGSVVVWPVAPDSFDSCPNGHVCLFANTNWGGAMVQFDTCCGWSNLSAYGFNETASSWRNRLSVDAQIAMNAGGGGSKLCLNNGSYSSSMPGGWDNAASSIRVRDGAAYC